LTHTKIFISLLVLQVVLAAGTAMAADPTYMVYGRVHTSVNFLNDGDQSGLSLTSNTSLFGFKGGFELNENFTAIWQFENAINSAQKSGSTGLASRNTFIGVTGNWGTLLAGIHDTPLKRVGRRATFFKDQIGDSRSMTMGHDLRLQDVLVYQSPTTASGFGGQLAYALDQNDWQAQEEPATAFSGMAFYAPEDLFLGVGYENLSRGFFAADPASEAKGEGVIRAAGRYNAERYGVAVLFQTVNNVRGADDVKSRTMGVEGLFKVATRWHLKGSYFRLDPNTEVDQDGAAQFAVGVDHPVTKNVMFYLQYAVIVNDDEANVAMIDPGDPEADPPVDPTFGPTGYGLGGSGWGGRLAPAIAPDGSPENPSGFSFGGVVTF